MLFIPGVSKISGCSLKTPIFKNNFSTDIWPKILKTHGFWWIFWSKMVKNHPLNVIYPRGTLRYPRDTGISLKISGCSLKTPIFKNTFSTDIRLKIPKTRCFWWIFWSKKVENHHLNVNLSLGYPSDTRISLKIFGFSLKTPNFKNNFSTDIWLKIPKTRGFWWIFRS